MTEKPPIKKILIVEDEMDMRFFLVTLLKSNGYQPVVARNGQEGLHQAAAMSPDLVLLDVMMPEQGGLIMYRQIKSDPKLKHIPVVMLSAVARATFHHSLAMLNTTRPDQSLPKPDAYIEKPPEADYVLDVIKRLI